MDGAGFRERLFLAWSLWQGRHQRRLTQTVLGEMVGRLRGDKVAQTTISDWFKSTVPDIHDIEYLAKALEVDPGWLAFGKATTAQGPQDPVRSRTESIPDTRKKR